MKVRFDLAREKKRGKGESIKYIKCRRQSVKSRKKNNSRIKKEGKKESE